MSWRSARKSLRSMSRSPCSSAMRKAMLSTPSCVSFRSRSRESSSGPISDTVARTRCPCSPKRSQNTTGNLAGTDATPISWARLTRGSLPLPGAAMPDRSPLISAAKTGTPALENPSASTWSETVLPVPVAPVIRPWRLASLKSRYSGLVLLPMKIFPSSSIVSLQLPLCHREQCGRFPLRRLLDFTPFRPKYRVHHGFSGESDGRAHRPRDRKDGPRPGHRPQGHRHHPRLPREGRRGRDGPYRRLDPRAVPVRVSLPSLRSTATSSECRSLFPPPCGEGQRVGVVGSKLCISLQ